MTRPLVIGHASPLTQVPSGHLSATPDFPLLPSAAALDAKARWRATAEWETRDRMLRRALDDARCSLSAEVALFIEGAHRPDALKRASAKERAALAAWLANERPGGDA